MRRISSSSIMVTPNLASLVSLYAFPRVNGTFHSRVLPVLHGNVRPGMRAGHGRPGRHPTVGDDRCHGDPPRCKVMVLDVMVPATQSM